MSRVGQAVKKPQLVHCYASALIAVFALSYLRLLARSSFKNASIRSLPAHNDVAEILSYPLLALRLDINLVCASYSSGYGSPRRKKSCLILQTAVESR